MQVIWAASALRDIDTIFNYVAKENPHAATQVVTTIEQGCTALDVFPNRGTPSRMADRRDLVFTPLPYIAVYRVTESAVIILRIYHSAQHWP